MKAVNSNKVPQIILEEPEEDFDDLYVPELRNDFDG